MNKEDMDTFVFCLGTKKTAARLVKDLADLVTDTGSLIYSIKITVKLYGAFILNNYLYVFLCFFFLVNFRDVNVTKLPETKKVLMFGFNLLINNCHNMDEAIEAMRPLLQLVFYMVDKVKRFKLSKEVKITFYIYIVILINKYKSFIKNNRKTFISSLNVSIDSPFILYTF